MQILQTLILVLFFIACAILIFLVMIQSGKGGSVGIFGGGGSTTPFGASTMDVVTKATWWMAGIFFVLALAAAVAFADSGPQIDVNPAEADDGLNFSDSAVPGGADAGATEAPADSVPAEEAPAAP